MCDIKKFHTALNKKTDRLATSEEAQEAFQNLSGFMSLLIAINEREQVIPTRPDRINRYADQ